MAKAKKGVKTETISSTKEEVKPVDEPKNPKKSHDEDDLKKIEVIGIAQAEGLQKAGWQLISVTLISNGKLYKFKR